MIKSLVLKIPTPVEWRDNNDSIPLLNYCKAKSHNKIFVICFSHDTETVYHWYIGEDFSNYCCIQFNAALLIPILEKAGFLCDVVTYKKMNNNKESNYTSTSFCLGSA